MLVGRNRKSTNGKPELFCPEPLSYNPAARRVFIMPGAGIWYNPQLQMGSPPELISGQIKYVEKILSSTATQTSKPEVYCFTYLDAHEKENFSRSHYRGDHKKQPEFLTEGPRAAKALIDSILTPGEKLESLEKDTLKQRLSRVTLIGYSYGSIQNQDIVNDLAHRLHDCKKFNDKEISEILRELVTINIGNIARLDDIWPFRATSISFCGLNDTTARNILEFHETFSNHSSPDNNNSPPLRLFEHCGYPQASTGLNNSSKPTITPLKKGGYIVRAYLPEEFSFPDIDPDGETITRTIDKKTAAETGVRTTHDFRNFMCGHAGMGQILSNVANNAVERDPSIGDGHRLFFRRTNAECQRSSLGRENPLTL